MPQHAVTPRDTLLQPAPCDRKAPKQPAARRKPRSPRSPSRRRPLGDVSRNRGGSSEPLGNTRSNIQPSARHTWVASVAEQATARGERAAVASSHVDASGLCTSAPTRRSRSRPRSRESREPLLSSGHVCVAQHSLDADARRVGGDSTMVQLDTTTGTITRPRTPGPRTRTPSPIEFVRGRTPSPSSLPGRADDATKQEFSELQRCYRADNCDDSTRIWFADASQWKRLPNNRLVAIAPVYSVLHEVPDERLNSKHGESLAVEFGFSIASPLSEVLTRKRWWKLQTQKDFRPCVMGLVLYKLRAWVHADSDPLFQAACADDVEKVNQICAAEPTRCCRVDFGGHTAMHTACAHGKLNALRALVEHAAQSTGEHGECRGRSEVLNLRTLSGETPLIVAAQHGRSFVIDWLLSATADARDTAVGVKPKLLVDINEQAWTEVSPSVVAQSADVLDVEESVAVGSQNVRRFPQRQGSTGVVGNTQDVRAGYIPRFAGTESGALTLAACAWDRRGGQTALIRAAAMGHAKTVAILLGYGASVTVKDAGGFNALHAAIIACVDLAVAPKTLYHNEDGPDISEGEMTRRMESTLTTQVEAIRELIRSLPPLPATGPNVGHTPLSVLVQVAAEVPPSCELATQLLDTLLDVLLIEANPCGFLVDQPSGKLGRTPLLWAVHTGNPPMVRRLLSHGASAHAQDSHGRNAVHTLVLAAGTGHISSTVTLELLNLLVDKHGVSVSATDSDGWTPLLLAVAGPPSLKVDARTTLCGTNYVTSTSHCNSVASRIAVVGEVVEWLLARGAGESIPVELADGRTAAAICLENGDKDGALRLMQEQRRFAKARQQLLTAQQSRIENARRIEKNAQIAMEDSAARAYADRVAAGSTESATSAARRDTYGAAGDWWAEQQKKLSKREAAAVEARTHLAEAEASDMENAMQEVHTKLAELKSAEAWERHHKESWISPALPIPITANVGGLVAQNRLVAASHEPSTSMLSNEERWVEQSGGQVLQSVSTDTLAATLGEMGFLGDKGAKRKAREEKTARVKAELAAQSTSADAGHQRQVYSNETINGAIEPFGTLTFQHVGIRAFQGRNFHLTESITTLNILSCPALEEIPGVVCLMPCLTELNVSNNSLINLPSGLGKLTKLDSLRCANNLLTALPGTLAMCLEMRTLDARQNGLASLPEDFAALQWLETLDLTDNCFGTFPLPVLELGSLTHLFLGSNSMSRLPDLSVLEMLASIDVSGNNLKDLSCSVWQLPRLRELRAVDNNIAELPVAKGTTFVRLKLRVLHLQNNRITSLPVQLAGLKSLVDVSLEGNLLAEALAGEDPTINQMRSTCEKHSGELRL